MQLFPKASKRHPLSSGQAAFDFKLCLSRGRGGVVQRTPSKAVLIQKLDFKLLNLTEEGEEAGGGRWVCVRWEVGKITVSCFLFLKVQQH